MPDFAQALDALLIFGLQRELPPGLSARDAKILKSVKRRAHYLDKGFNLCGMRFGWTFIIGMLRHRTVLFSD